MVLLADGVVLVVVAPGTFKSQAQKSGPESVRTVLYVFDTILFGNNTALGGDFMVSVEARCQNLLLGRVR